MLRICEWPPKSRYPTGDMKSLRRNWRRENRRTKRRLLPDRSDIPSFEANARQRAPKVKARVKELQEKAAAKRMFEEFGGSRTTLLSTRPSTHFG
jgi:hypothetical protein